MNLFKKIRGGALLTALFIMTLVAIVATAMTLRLQVDIYRTRMMIMHDNLYLASQGVTFWALDSLTNPHNLFTHANLQGMVSTFPPNKATIYDKVQLSGEIYDLQSRININNLIEKASFPLFLNLMNHLHVKINKKDRFGLVLAIHHWISPYDLDRGKDEYMDYYLAQKPPYYPSHQLMVSPSELRLVKGVSAPLYQQIQPFITALPEVTATNINTAPKIILMSLGNGLSEKQANKIIAARKEKGINPFQDINKLLNQLNISTNQLTIESHYFLSVAHAHQDSNDLTVYTLFKRSRDEKGKIVVRILQQELRGN